MTLPSNVSDQLLKQVCRNVVIHIKGKNVPGMLSEQGANKIFMFIRRDVM